MAEVKWIKLSINMFDNRKIKYLRSLPEGNNIILIWVMLLTIAGRCNAKGRIFLVENIPYNTKILADELDFEENTIILALNALEKLGMIERQEDTIYIPGWEEHQNIDGLEKIREQNRIRKQRQREREAEQIECHVTSHGNVTDVHATDKELDKELDKEKHKKHKVHEARALFEILWKLYPLKRGKGQVSDEAKMRLLDIGLDEMLRVIDRYKADLQKNTWRKPQNGSTFFRSGYIDYLDCNYNAQEEERAVIPHPENKAKNQFQNFPQRDVDYDAIVMQQLTGTQQ